MATELDIAHMALGHLGVTRRLTSLADDTESARACDLFFGTCRDEVLRAFPWPFATVQAELDLVEDLSNNDTAEWTYSYRYPADCLRFLRIRSGAGRRETAQTRVANRVIRDTTGRLILTDQADAVAEYVQQVTDPAVFSPDFVTALSYRLAGAIAPAVTSGDPNRLGLRALQLYDLAIRQAQATALNEQRPDADTSSGFLAARNGLSREDGF